MDETVPRSVFLAFCFRGCRPGSLIAQMPEKELGDFFEKIAVDSGFTPVARYIKIYPDRKGNPGKGGYTAEITLEESSANVYTWPEDGDVEGDIFYCNYEQNNAHKADKLYTSLLEFFQPKEVEKFGPWHIFRKSRPS